MNSLEIHHSINPDLNTTTLADTREDNLSNSKRGKRPRCSSVYINDTFCEAQDKDLEESINQLSLNNTTEPSLSTTEKCKDEPLDTITKEIKHFCIGIVDFGEKDYLTKCIHEGTTPISRMDNLSYILIGFDEYNEPVDHIFTVIDRNSIKVDKPQSNERVSSQDSNQETDSINPKQPNETDENSMHVEPIEVDINDPISSSIGTVAWNMDKKTNTFNEVIYDVYSAPPNIKYIALILDTTKFTKEQQYYFYLIEPSEEQIYSSFYIPDFLNENRHHSQEGQYKIILVIERFNNSWTFTQVKNQKSDTNQSLTQ